MMDPQPLLWEAAQHLTGGLLHGAFSPQQLRGYALFRAPTIPRGVIQSAIDEGEEIYWKSVGDILIITPVGAGNLWSRYGKPSPRNRAPQRQNATARYFAQEWNRIIPHARAYLAKKLRRSAELDKLDDHIHDWIVRAIERNYLEKYLKDGKVPASLVCLFMYHTASSSLRKDGRNPACRATQGALAPHEVKARKEDDRSWTEIVEPTPLLLGEDPLANMADRSTAMIEELDIGQVSELVANLLEVNYMGIRLYDVFEAQYDDGLGVDQTARKLASSRTVVQAARREIRSLLERSRGDIRNMGFVVGA